MNQILRVFVLKKNIFFFDDISIKDCKDETQNLTMEENACRTFVKKYTKDVECILKRLEEVNLFLFLEKSTFGFKESMVVGHL